MQDAQFVPRRRNRSNELRRRPLAFIGHGAVGEHLQRSLEEHVQRQLVGPGSRPHRIGVGRTVLLGLRGEHRAGREVHRPHGVADERQQVAVLGLAARPLLHAEHTLVIDEVGVGPEKPLRSVGAVPVHQQAMFRGAARHTLVIGDHPLIAAVHEVDLHARNAPLLELPEEALHVALDGQPREPEYDPDAALPAVGDQLLEVEVRIGAEHVGRRCRPPLVHDDIGNAVLGGEVDVTAVGLRIASGAEIDARKTHAVPPVPAHQTGLHPTPVPLGGRFGQQPHQLLPDEIGIFARHGGHGNVRAPSVRAI